MRIIRGIAASPGIAIGPAHVFQPEDLHVPVQFVSNPEAEWQRMQEAFQKAKNQLQEIASQAAGRLQQQDVAIFEAHLQMLEDPELQASVQAAILHEGKNAESALMENAERYAVQLESLNDEYFRARAADIRDVARRCLRILLGKPQPDITLLQPSILVARDLTPSDTVLLDKSRLLGFCTAEGGATSHTAILAKALGIPAVVGAGPQVLEIEQNQQLVLDAWHGQVVLDPSEDILKQFQDKQRAARAQAAQERADAAKPAITRDGRRVEVVANVGHLDDAHQAVALGAEGIGLLRTEFLYLDRQTEPDEEEQYCAYRAIFEVMGERPVVIRTLDVGGDKALPYLDLGHEENPFLGWRAIRMCLDRPAFFKTQLRAILRAAVGHDIRIMFPMIATVREVRQARALLEEARLELEHAGVPFGRQIQVGIMIEIPSAALMADALAKEVDFFSIGTNDLTQYTLAVERTNKRVAHLSNALDPAVLRLIARVIEEGHRAGIWVGMCGEMAGDERALPFCLAWG
ncbi:MAG: phosphoenolpyruvate--protein phosphotransferase [Anaerolineales bacterium]|nr:phosphoenolpyruvate--protein phosphotransferase [Anaerolineales bacterium]